MTSTDLPIHQVLPEVVAGLRRGQDIVLQAPPGAGKSTVLPLALIEQPWLTGKILMLEPRRIAARNVAARMAAMLGEPVGQRIGYRMRQDTRVSRNTCVEVVTEGVLTRMLLDDPALSDYHLILFDEFHERHLDADMAITLTLEGRRLFRGPEAPLQMVVMSATLDREGMQRLLPEAAVIHCEGRLHPVTIRHINAGSQSADPIAATAQQVRNALPSHSGSILVFLPGRKEINGVQALLADVEAEVLPLHGGLTFAEQTRAIAPGPARKVVLATDIAETSLTIEGIEVVIDSGYRRAPVFDPKTGLTRLHTVAVSKASAEQRAGRAGRLGPGFCYRLWPREKTLAPFAPPEIAQTDLLALALNLLAWGVDDPHELTWLTPPAQSAFQQAVDLLHQLEAIAPVAHSNRQRWQLTEHGTAMTRFPAHPRLTHMMLSAPSWHACLLAAAMSEARALEHDLEQMIERISTPTAKAVRGLTGADKDRDSLVAQARQFAQLLKDKMPADSGSAAAARPRACDYATGMLVALAYPDRIARQRSSDHRLYLFSNGRAARLPNNSTLLDQPWLAVAEVGGQQDNANDRIVTAARFDERWLSDELKHLAVESTVTGWDESCHKFVAERRQQVGAIVLRRHRLDEVPAAIQQQAVAHYLLEQRLAPLAWTPQTRAWCDRVLLLRAHTSDLHDWPDVSIEGLIQSVSTWLTPHLSRVRTGDDFAKLDLMSMLGSLLPWPLPRILEQWAPTHWQVPSGSRIAIDYAQDPPVLAVKLQEMFGCQSTPAIALERVPLQLHLLSPARRPLQVTQDMAGFWRNSYEPIKREMKGRYPKHPWPDDPLAATPTAFTKKKSWSR